MNTESVPDKKFDLRKLATSNPYFRIIVFYILTPLILAFSYILIFSIIDFHRVKNKKKPLVCMKQKSYMDGGTTEYKCLGYSLTFHNKLHSLEKDGETIHGHMRGVHLKYSLFNYEYKEELVFTENFKRKKVEIKSPMSDYGSKTE